MRAVIELCVAMRDMDRNSLKSVGAQCHLTQTMILDEKDGLY